MIARSVAARSSGPIITAHAYSHAGTATSRKGYFLQKRMPLHVTEIGPWPLEVLYAPSLS